MTHLAFAHKWPGLITHMEGVVLRMNEIERVRATRDEITRDVLAPDAEQKLTTNRMPHYATCYAISDLVQTLLQHQWIESSLLLFRDTQQGIPHIAVGISEDENALVGWYKDRIILTNEDTYRELFRRTHNGLSLSDGVTPITHESLNQILREDERWEVFARYKVAQILRASMDPSNDYLMQERFSLAVIDQREEEALLQAA